MKNKFVENLALNKEVDKNSPKIPEIVRLGLLNFGNVSIPYIMRKLKCSESRAKEIIASIESYT